MNLTIDLLKRSFANLGYSWSPNTPNIIGIRTNLDVPNVFNDFIGVVIEDKNIIQFFEGTTEPGTYWLENPMNVKGTSILVPSQYKNSWVLGTHGKGLNAHEALIQSKPVEVWRDNNKDNKIYIDPKSINKGIFGINIHSTGILGYVAPSIDKWSAGCQVIKRYDTFKNKFLPLVKSSGQKEFTYTLLTEKQLI